MTTKKVCPHLKVGMVERFVLARCAVFVCQNCKANATIRDAEINQTDDFRALFLKRINKQNGNCLHKLIRAESLSLVRRDEYGYAIEAARPTIYTCEECGGRISGDVEVMKPIRPKEMMTPKRRLSM